MNHFEDQDDEEKRIVLVFSQFVIKSNLTVNVQQLIVIRYNCFVKSELDKDVYT